MTDPSSSSPHRLSLLLVIPFLFPLRVLRVIFQHEIARSESEPLFSGPWQIYFSILCIPQVVGIANGRINTMK
jgi:hypothetical protein